MMRLQDVCELIVDCPHSTAKDEGIGYPLIRTPNIGKGRLILDGVHRVSEEVYHKRNQRAVPQDGDLIFLDSSSSVLHIADFVSSFKDITVVTNGLIAAKKLAEVRNMIEE